MADRVRGRVAGKDRSEKMRLRTGIHELDDMLCGGFLPGGAVLLAGGAGTGKTTLAIQHLVNGATQFGENGIYVTFRCGAATTTRD